MSSHLCRPVSRAFFALSAGEYPIIDHVNEEDVIILNKNTGRKKVIDVKYTIYPHISFIKQQRRSIAILKAKKNIKEESLQLGVTPKQLTS